MVIFVTSQDLGSPQRHSTGCGFEGVIETTPSDLFESFWMLELVVADCGVRFLFIYLLHVSMS